jgi:hypothetical protein
MSRPLAYFITFTCYGSHLHGRLAMVKVRMDEAPYVLGVLGRQVVLESLREVCSHRKWTLIAAYVRTTHVHVVVDSDETPARVLHDLKAYATRALNGVEGRRKRWARHGSTRYLWTTDEVQGATDYVLARQGEPMAVFPLPEASAP